VTLAVLCSSFVDFAFEAYCGYRIRIASQRWEFPVVIWMVALARFGCNIASAALVFSVSLPEFITLHDKLLKVPYLSGLILNAFIALALTYYTFFGGGGVPKSKPTWRRILLFSIGKKRTG